jgi:hypothetical protein
VNLDPVYDIYKTFTTTEYLAGSAGRSASVKGVGRMGAAGLIALFFVMIFKLTLPPPEKVMKTTIPNISSEITTLIKRS